MCIRDRDQLRENIRANHQLLKRIGVVPNQVSQFISEIESLGGAAKICGSGSVEGDAGGVVLVLADEMPSEICDKFGFKVSPLRGDPLGTRLV